MATIRKTITVQLDKRETEILKFEMEENDLTAGKLVREALLFYHEHKECKLNGEIEK